MLSFCSFFSLRKTEIFQILLIILSWVLGLLSSVVVLSQYSFSLMCPLNFDRVSIVAMIVSLVFPIVLSYILLNRCNIYLVLPVIYLKSFLYMSCYFAITLTFGSAGWLVRTLVLFSDSVSVLLLLILCYRYITKNKVALYRFFRIAILILFLIGSLDYYIISPFIMTLLNY